MSSSSSDVGGPLDQGLIQGHPWLQFGDDSVSRNRCQRLLKRPIGAHRSICWDSLSQLDAADRARAIIGDQGPWSRLFDLTSLPSYRELMVEFLSSFRFRPRQPGQPEDDEQLPSEIAFSIMGHAYQMSLREFAVRTGLYWEPETVQEVYTAGVWTVERTILLRFWSVIARDPYMGAASKATSIIDPLHRYLHMAIANSIRPRGRGTEHVTEIDLFFMYCLIWRREPCALARCLAQFFQSAFRGQGRGRLYGGCYITRIAQGMGHRPDTHPLVSAPVLSTRLDMASIRGMRVTGTFDGHPRFIDRDGHLFVPVPLPDELPLLQEGAGEDAGEGGGEPAGQEGGQQPPQPEQVPPPQQQEPPQYPEHVYREVQLAAPVRAQIEQILQQQDQIIAEQAYQRECFQFIIRREMERAQAAGRVLTDVPVPPVLPQDPAAAQGAPPPP